ncbi:MAG: hypothetical protein KBD53_08680 [Candidatus Omnitrophica bacterium]|nr:hypothetical protein [Candidatus Omnitrophota bacterium]
MKKISVDIKVVGYLILLFSGFNILISGAHLISEIFIVGSGDGRRILYTFLFLIICIFTFFVTRQLLRLKPWARKAIIWISGLATLFMVIQGFQMISKAKVTYFITPLMFMISMMILPLLVFIRPGVRKQFEDAESNQTNESISVSVSPPQSKVAFAIKLAGWSFILYSGFHIVPTSKDVLYSLLNSRYPLAVFHFCNLIPFALMFIVGCHILLLKSWARKASIWVSGLCILFLIYYVNSVIAVYASRMILPYLIINAIFIVFPLFILIHPKVIKQFENPESSQVKEKIALSFSFGYVSKIIGWIFLAYIAGYIGLFAISSSSYTALTRKSEARRKAYSAKIIMECRSTHNTCSEAFLLSLENVGYKPDPKWNSTFRIMVIPKIVDKTVKHQPIIFADFNNLKSKKDGEQEVVIYFQGIDQQFDSWTMHGCLSGSLKDEFLKALQNKGLNESDLICKEDVGESEGKRTR